MNESIPTIRLADGPTTRPVVLCVPGAMCPPEVFSDMAQLIGCETHGLAWLEGPAQHDLHSVAQRVAQLVGTYREVVLIGHSIGVPISALAARQCLKTRRGKIAGIVLSNSGVNTAGHGDIDVIINRVLTEWGPTFWDQFLERCLGSTLSDHLMATCQAYPGKLQAAAVAQAVASQKQIDLRAFLPEFTGFPAVVLHGSTDKARTLAHAQELAAYIPGAQLYVLDTGHTSMAESPRLFADKVLSLLSRIDCKEAT
jgi:3-oxoadipate enol-lactonase